MSEAIIRTEALEVGYGRRALLPPLEVEIRARETWAIAGHNGSGKTTFLRTILGLLSPVSGRVVRRADAYLSYVPQRREDDEGVPARVQDYVKSGLDRGRSFLDPFYPLKHADRAVRAMEDTEVLELAKTPFEDLSEGQKQRVQIARALASDPHIVLLDEPTSAMDPKHEEAVFGLLARQKDERGIAFVVVSHHMSFIPEHATHVLFVDADRRIAVHGTRDEVVASEHFQLRYGAP